MSDFLSRGMSAASDLKNRVSQVASHALEVAATGLHKGGDVPVPPELAEHAKQDEQLRAVYKAADAYIQRLNAMCEASTKLAEAFDDACASKPPLDRVSSNFQALQTVINKEHLTLLGQMMHRKLFRPIRQEIEARKPLDAKIAESKKARAEFEAYKRRVTSEMEREGGKREQLSAELRQAEQRFRDSTAALVSEVNEAIEARNKILCKGLLSWVTIQHMFFHGTEDAIGTMSENIRETCEHDSFAGVGIIPLLDQSVSDCKVVKEHLAARRAQGGGGSATGSPAPSSGAMDSSQQVPQAAAPPPREAQRPPQAPTPPPQANLLDPGPAPPMAAPSAGSRSSSPGMSGPGPDLLGLGDAAGSVSPSQGRASPQAIPPPPVAAQSSSSALPPPPPPAAAPAPLAHSGSNSDSMDLLGSMGFGPSPDELLMAQMGGGSLTSSPAQSRPSGGDLMGGMEPAPSLVRPPAGQGGSAANLDDMLNFGSPPPPQQRAQVSSDDPFGMGAAPAPSAGGGGYMGAAAAVAAGGVPSPSGPPAPREELARQREARTEAAAQEKVEEQRRQKAAEEAAKESKRDMAKEVKAKVDGWRQGKKNMRAVLSSLHEILPEGIKWTPVGLAQLLQPSDVKKAYRKSLLIIHPDKLPDSASLHDQVLAQEVFDAVRECWTLFQHEL